MEPISEERQRAIYEFVYSELKGKDWYIKGGTQALCYDEEGSLVCPIDDYLQPLYIKHNGEMVPNVQFFIDECVPQLEGQGGSVWRDPHGVWAMDSVRGGLVPIHSSPDPYAALVEMLEAK